MASGDLREELSALSRELKEYLVWHRVNGAIGLPASRARPSAGTSEAASPEGSAVGVQTRAGSGPSDREGVRTSSARASEPAAFAADTKPSELPQRAVSAAPQQAPQAFDLAEAHRRLKLLEQEVRTCTRCGLSSARTQTVFARGQGSSRLCFVGEGPGADEDAQGYPFVGKAGKLLDRMIEAMGFTRDEVYVCNIVKCRPPNNRKPEPQEMQTCVPYLHTQLELIQPEVIVALGATAVEGLLGVGGGITRLRGNWRLYRGKIAVMPTFHPAYLLRNPSAKRQVWEDLQAVLRQMGRPIPGAPKGGAR